MDKLRTLLKGIGATDDLADAICEEFVRYENALKEKYDEDYRDKIIRAKEICMEEVDKEKARLARLTKVYLESKASSMEQAAARNMAAEETEAASTLKRVMNLLEGVDPDDAGNSREVQAMNTKMARLERVVEVMKEERLAAIEKANRANQIADNLLKKNRILESTLKKFGSMDKPGKEDEQASEEKEKPKKKLDESRTVGTRKRSKKESRERLDSKRSTSQRPVSTRRTLAESQTRNSNQASEIDKIAQNMPE